jgi:hypothetical protein
MHVAASVNVLRLVSLLVFAAPSLASGQSLRSGLGLEAGLDLNQLFWTAYPPGADPTTAHRWRQFLTPTVRIHYSAPVVAHAQVMIFAGYSEFGGRSPQLSDPIGSNSSYRDSFRFRALEAGLFGFCRLSHFQVGLCAKANRHLSIDQRVQRLAPGRDGPIQEYETSDVSDFFDPWSGHAGARIEWEPFPSVILSGEGWMGITRIEGSGLSDVIDARQNHFRLLLGYRL